jgi:hypothetical protein
MKDEIKEILINKLDAIEELNKNSATIMIGELKETILYITNLQKENERLNIQIEMAFKKAYPFVVENGIICRKNKEIDNYKSRIDKAKAKLKSMFDNGNEKTILDDLLELDSVLGENKVGDDNE